MAEVGITAIVVGAILFVLGFFPGLLPALMARVQSLRDQLFPSRGHIRKRSNRFANVQRRLVDRQWRSDANLGLLVLLR
jgi:hypothetical protein